MVNKGYLPIIKNIKSAFEKEGSIELKRFLEEKEYSSLRKQSLSIKAKKSIEVMSHKSSYAKIKLPDEINSFVKTICGKRPANWEIWQFAASDYTVINDEKLEKSGIDAIIDITENWNNDFGGSIVYVDGSGDYTKISSEKNKLILVRRGKGKHRFIQYVNHKCKKNKRVFLIARF